MVCRNAAAALAAALLALASATSAAAASTISEYSSGLASNAEPLSIVAGPDANLWFTQGGPSGAIDRMTLAGGISSYETGAGSVSLTTAPDGKLWFTESGGSAKIGTIDPVTGLVSEYPLPVGGTLTGITAGPEGDVWYLIEVGGGEAMIGRIVPSTQKVTEFKLKAGSKPAQITVGPEGSLWFTESNGAGAIGKFDPNTKVIVEYTYGLTPKNSPAGITTGPDGNIWFTEASKEPKIGRINPQTDAITEFSSGLTVGTPQRIVTGSDENLYFTESSGNGALGQITPTGQITEFKTGLSEKGEPWGITSGPDGNIWFTEEAKPARIGRLTVAPTKTAPAAGNEKLTAGLGTSSPTSAPTSAPIADSGAALAVPPVIGRLAGVERVSGTVLVNSPSSGGFVPLSGAATVPVGSVLDATHGVVRLVTALDTHGRAQSALVWAGVFQIGQSTTGNGETRLILRGELSTCAQTKRAHSSSARKQRAKIRKLWAQDEHGRYSTYGANSAATVLGTKWETVDTCSGTLTRVVRGKVRVQDLERKVTVVVSAGHSYLAQS